MTDGAEALAAPLVDADIENFADLLAHGSHGEGRGSGDCQQSRPAAQPLIWPLSAAGEAVGRRDDGLAHARMAGIVAGLVHQDQLAAGPALREAPGRDERIAEVQASM